MTQLRITGGRVYDPANGIDGEVRDVCIDAGTIVDTVPPTAQQIDARGMIVMPGGVDIHSHVASSSVNLARRLLPEEHHADPATRPDLIEPLARSGSGGTVPTTFTTGYRYAGLGYTTVFDAAVAPVAARLSHAEFDDTPIVDGGFFVLLGNDEYLLRLIDAGERERAREYAAWVVNATGAWAGTIGAMVGDTVTLTTPTGSLTPMGVMPRMRRFKIVGTFRLGFFDVDSTIGLVAIEPGLRLAGVDKVSHIEVKIADVYSAPRVADQIASEFGPDYVTQDWTDINQQLYSALMLEKIGMGIGIGLIMMVAALNIIASLILLVMEKTRDIAILKTMGASQRSIMLVFLLQGTIIGVIGTVLGAAAGTTIATIADRYQLISIPGDVYQVSYLPFTVLPGDLAAVIVGAVVVCFVATLYPSRQAAKLDPAQALRYE